MKKTLTVLTLALFLGACRETMPNDEIIAETKKCEEAGMQAVPLFSGFTLTRIQCRPKETP